MFRGDRQFDETALRAVFANLFQIDIQLAQPDLDCHFPKSCGADVDLGSALDEFSGLG
ncbi:hypothetical protein D3C86_2260490 [compost metagenome]